MCVRRMAMRLTAKTNMAPEAEQHKIHIFTKKQLTFQNLQITVSLCHCVTGFPNRKRRLGMNRLLQGSFAFVLVMVAISGVSGKESKQLTDEESRHVVGSAWGICTSQGMCECAALPPPIPGQGPCSGGCTPGSACRACDAASVYRTCAFSFFQDCTGGPVSCGDQIDGGFCGGAPAFTCAINVGTVTNLGACNSSQCTF
jgi:hypothetical protein